MPVEREISPFKAANPINRDNEKLKLDFHLNLKMT